MISSWLNSYGQGVYYFSLKTGHDKGGGKLKVLVLASVVI